jgi:1-acyl-sn-glycerol-3-phosphate acyltransferase
MFQKSGEALRAGLTFILFTLNTALVSLVLYILLPFKLLLPFKWMRSRIDACLERSAEVWVGVNAGILAFTQSIQWDVQGLENLRPRNTYVISANHQSWVDILVLQRVLHRKVPFLRFFIKKQLLWVPLLGGAWWVLDFPFMRRHSKAYLDRHPEKRGQDLVTAQRACEKLKARPTSILNFLEGTRFTQKKHDAQNSPYRYLLRPKSGGVATTLAGFGPQQSLLDVTIVFPQRVTSLYGFFAGRISHIVVRIREIPIPERLSVGNYIDDPEFRINFQAWIDEIWRSKDLLISQNLHSL